MEIQEDASYGVIPVIKNGQTWKVFLIHQFGSGGDIFWTFPKGHEEEGESPEQAATRELKEETGLQIEKLDTKQQFTQSYSFIFENTRIEKRVVYFLGYVTDGEYEVQEDEVKEAGWFSRDEALDKLTFDDSKRILEEAFSTLEGLE